MKITTQNSQLKSVKLATNKIVDYKKIYIWQRQFFIDYYKKVFVKYIFLLIEMVF